MSQEAPVTDHPAEATASENSSNSMSNRKKPKKLDQDALQKAPPPELDEDLFDEVPEPVAPPKRTGGRRMVPVHQSRIADRPAKVGEKDSSLKIKIELDLEVEVEIYARVKGDVTIGLM